MSPSAPRSALDGSERLSSNGEPSALGAVLDRLEALAGRLDAPLAPPDALLDKHAAASLLAVPATWLMAEARADRVPHVRLGHYVRFERDALLEWRAAQARGPRTGSRPVTPPAGSHGTAPNARLRQRPSTNGGPVAAQ